jgi:hypothetical protein
VKRKRFLKKINKKQCLLNSNQVNQQISTIFALSANIKMILAIKNNELMTYQVICLCLFVFIFKFYSIFFKILFNLYLFICFSIKLKISQHLNVHSLIEIQQNSLRKLVIWLIFFLSLSFSFSFTSYDRILLSLPLSFFHFIRSHYSLPPSFFHSFSVSTKLSIVS